MDEGLLNDLLECSVCLERLDTSSRVLPCQHTFCLKCLKVIIESHKELRCPECRVLVEAKVEELPPNVLLMRILEGMKNSAPRKVAAPAARHRGAHSQGSQQVSTPHKDKQLPPHARAMHDYISKEPGDLSFKKGETILLQKKLDAFWYQGETGGRSGMFPITYVQVVVPLPTPTALCKALYDFRMSAPDEEGCLAFDKGAIITVHRRVDENWAEGRLQQRVGIFPIAFVELNQPARQLMNSPPLNRAVPPLPDVRTNVNEHRHHAQHSHRYQPMSMSTPATQTNYQNIGAMSQSQPTHTHTPTHTPAYQQLLLPSPAPAPAPAPANILEPAVTKHKHHLIHHNLHNKVQAAGTGTGTVTLQSVSINHDRLRLVKYDYNSTTPVHKADTYQNVRTDFPVSVANFNANNISSDSSSSMNTASAGSTTTPNSSNTSSSDSNPSLPSSPDNAVNTTLITEEATVETLDASLDTSMGVLSLNESSTATNTSLNVSLPPAESPKPNETSQEPTETRLDAPSSSKKTQPARNGPDSLLNFGIGLQAALSPSHGAHVAEGYSRHRDHPHRDKRHSLTPSSHLQNHTAMNRHSAEIVATSLLDAAPRDRRRRSRSNERPLPCAYVALYPYKPHKPDELELHKGAIYTVTERCRDGWYKGCSERSQRCGVFPGNYVAPAPHHTTKHDKSVSSSKTAAIQPPTSTASPATPANTATPVPAAPPRTNSPLNTGQPLSYPWCSTSVVPSSVAPPQQQHTTPRNDKSRDKSKAEKSSISGVSLMKRLAAMKKCKSPPPSYSMDNPVFEDTPSLAPANPAGATPAPAAGPSLAQHAPQHVRSGSCPSQLLRAISHSERVRHKERPSLRAINTDHKHRPTNLESPWQTQHRKSQSLDVTAVTRRDRHHTQVKERFRCIVPYPPNSEFELELKMDDIVIVSKKRGDGWYKGTLQRTGRTGLFPASFVQRCPQE